MVGAAGGRPGVLINVRVASGRSSLAVASFAAMDARRVGVWTSQLGVMPHRDAMTAASQLEALGYEAIWFPESFTKEAIAQAALLLDATDRVAICTGIANIWARDPVATINAARTLSEAHPSRFVLGLGVSHAPTVARRGHDYRAPLFAMAAYLEQMHAAGYGGPVPDVDPVVVLAALGPQMLRLAASATAGAHPYFSGVRHTALARDVMGPNSWLAPEHAVVLDTDPGRARATARSHMTRYLSVANYRNNLLRLGWTESDLAGGGSDALVDSLVAWGDEAEIRAAVDRHFEAGADHVCIQVLNGLPDRFPAEEYRALAGALLEG